MIEMMARLISLAIWGMDYKPRDPLYAPDERYHLALKAARAVHALTPAAGDEDRRAS